MHDEKPDLPPFFSIPHAQVQKLGYPEESEVERLQAEVTHLLAKLLSCEEELTKLREREVPRREFPVHLSFDPFPAAKVDAVVDCCKSGGDGGSKAGGSGSGRDPFHTEPSTIHAALHPLSLPIGSSEPAPALGASFMDLFGPKAWRRTAAPVAAMDGGTPISPPALPPSAPPPRTERSVQDGVGLSQAPVPSKIRMERSTRGGLDRARTPAPADGGVYVDPIRALAKPSRMAAITEAVRPGVKRPTQPKPMWSAKASQPGLFDHTLGSRALRDDELQARLGRQARGGAASHGDDGLRDIEEQFHRVRCRDNWVHSGSRMSNVRVLNSRGSCNSACSTLAIVVCFCELAIPYNLVHRIPAVVEDRIPAYHQIAYQSVLYDLGVGPRATWPRFWGTGRRH